MTTHTRFESLAALAVDFELTPAERAELDGPSGDLLRVPVGRGRVPCRRGCAAVPIAVRRAPGLGPGGRRSRRPRAGGPAPSSPGSSSLPRPCCSLRSSLRRWRSGHSIAVRPSSRCRRSRRRARTGPWSQAASHPDVLAAQPSNDASAEPAEYTPPTPVCPAPATAPAVPDVTVSVGTAPGRKATFWGAGIRTCSTTGTDDGVPSPPTAIVSAKTGDRFTLALPTGWSFLHVDADRFGHDIERGRAARDRGDGPPVPHRGAGHGGTRRIDRRLRHLDHLGRSARRGRVVGRHPGQRRRHGPSPTPGTDPERPDVPRALRPVADQPILSPTPTIRAAVELVLARERLGRGGDRAARCHDGATSVVKLRRPIPGDAWPPAGDRLVWVETWRDIPRPPTTRPRLSHGRQAAPLADLVW